MSAPVGLNPKLLEKVMEELANLRKEREKVEASKALQEYMNRESELILKLVRNIELSKATELKEMLREFRRFNEQLKRALREGKLPS